MRFSGKQYHSAYFIGIGGVSMSALACYLKENGITVFGSDERDSELISRLRFSGIPVSIGTSEKFYADLVVYTGAVPPDHPQLRFAKEKRIPCVERSEFLGEISSSFEDLLSVAGCHGKTTTTCMLAHIFLHGKREFTAHIGGEDLDFGNYLSTGDHTFLTEACEFRRSFLSLRGGTAVILNCDLDHTDCYNGAEELADTYRQFASQAERAVVNADDPVARSIPHALSFGLYAGDVRAERLCADGEKYSFTVTERDVPLARIKLNAVGKVHVYNALAAFAAARLHGFSCEEIAGGIQSFRGVKRRFEKVGTLGDIPVICDYAHHPREILSTLSTAEKLCDGKVHLVFQPHTYTRTRDLFYEFKEVLSRAEEPILYRTYAAREKFEFCGSAAALAASIPSAQYVQSAPHLKARLLGRIQRGDLILVLGAGDIYDIVKTILDPL